MIGSGGAALLLAGHKDVGAFVSSVSRAKVMLRCGAEQLWFKARKALRQDTVLMHGPVRIDILAEEEERSGRAGIVLPGQLDKVVKAGFKRDLRYEIETFMGAPRKIAATRRIELQNAFIHRTDFFRHGRRKFFRVADGAMNENRRMERHRDVVVRSSIAGCHFFGDWIRDDCATTLIDEDESFFELFMPTPPWPDKFHYRDLFEFNQSELYACAADRLVFYEDGGQTGHKVRRLSKLRDKVRTKLHLRNGAGIVYIRRGANSAHREMVNEEEIVEQLERRGVTILEAERHDLQTTLRSLGAARLLIGVEGSQLCHGIYGLRGGAGVLVIQPPDRFFNSHMDWSQPLDIHYGAVVGDPVPGGFTLRIDDLLRTIDLFPA